MGGWTIEAKSHKMAKDIELEALKERLGGVIRTPEIVFLDNILVLHHNQTSALIKFNAFDALMAWTSSHLPPFQVLFRGGFVLE